MSITLYTHPQLRKHQIKANTSPDTIWYNPFSLESSCFDPPDFYKQLRLATYKLSNLDEGVFWLPEAGLNEYYILRWITNYCREKFVKDKNIHIATNHQDIYGWIKVCCYLEFIDKKQVKIMWEHDVTDYSYDDTVFFPSYWPDGMLEQFNWFDVVFVPNDGPMKSYLDIKYRKLR